MACGRSQRDLRLPWMQLPRQREASLCLSSLFKNLDSPTWFRGTQTTGSEPAQRESRVRLARPLWNEVTCAALVGVVR